MGTIVTTIKTKATLEIKDFQIARAIIAKAVKAGKTDETSALKADLYLQREINLHKLAQNFKEFGQVKGSIDSIKNEIRYF